MNQPRSIRMTPAADISNKTRDAFRMMETRSIAPWSRDDFPKDAKQRTYSGFHLLVLAAMEQGSVQGLPEGRVAEFIRFNPGPFKRFLEKVSRGEEPGDTVTFPLFFEGIMEEFTGFRWQPLNIFGGGSAKEAANAYEDALNRVGTEITCGHGNKEYAGRIVCGPQVATVNIAEAYRMLKIRARSKGFIVDGFDVFPLPPEDADPAPEEDV